VLFVDTLSDVSRSRGQYKLEGFISLEARDGRRDSVQLARTYLCSDVRSPSIKKSEWRWCGNTVTREGSRCRRTSRESRHPFWYQQKGSRPIRYRRRYMRATRTAITKDCRLTCLGLLTSAVSALFEATRSRYLESGWNTEMSKSRENVLGPSARNWIG
jgi:hypothetical protein